MKFYVQRKMAAVKRSGNFYSGVIPALHSSSDVFSRSNDDVRKESKGLAMVHMKITYVQSKLDHICSSRAPNSSSTYALAYKK